jgi:hypothetical protein
LKCGELISYQLIDQTALEAIQSHEITVRVTDIDEVSLGLLRVSKGFSLLKYKDKPFGSCAT